MRVCVKGRVRERREPPTAGTFKEFWGEIADLLSSLNGPLIQTGRPPEFSLRLTPGEIYRAVGRPPCRSAQRPPYWGPKGPHTRHWSRVGLRGYPLGRPVTDVEILPVDEVMDE